MPALVLLGAQWGDEGKGKATDLLGDRVDYVVRYQGGNNAGHTVVIGDQKYALHLLPSGILSPNVVPVIGNGVVIDVITLRKEINALLKMNVPVAERLFISRKANLILPTHRLLDAASEALKGADKIGSTLRGIGPAYMDKTGRNGLRMGDTESTAFRQRYDKLKQKHLELLRTMNYDASGLSEMEKDFFDAVDFIRTLNFVDSEHLINGYIRSHRSVLAEGAQGSLLDIDFGSYPFVTSSNTITAGACTGLGIAPRHIGKVYGIFKAYCTRVGSGPFPTELNDATGEAIRKAGNEFGATTGRPRRCGWLDLPALRYAIMINGVSDLTMTKPDVLSNFDTINVCTHYEVNGEKIHYLPYDIVHTEIKPMYTSLPGWKKDLTGITREEDFPKELSAYIQWLEEQLNVPVSIVSVGPDRKQTIIRNK